MKRQSPRKVRKKTLVPDWEETEFVKTMDGQLMLMVKGALRNGSYVEAQTLSWTTIEQLLLPRLIGWIARVHKLDLPNEVLS